MKKSLILTLGLFVSLIGFMSCGGGADDEARQKAILDSLRNDSIMKAQAEMAMMDSLRNDSIMKAQQAYADSLAAALEAAGNSRGTTPKNPKGGNTTTTTTTTTTTPPVTPEPVKTGKDAVKSGTDSGTSGKDAIKNSTGGDTKTGTSGKNAIKGK